MSALPDARPAAKGWWRYALNGLVLVAVLVVAGVVAHTAPTKGLWQAPIPVAGALGEEIAGRNLVATIDGVRVAEQVTAANGWAGETTGVWVVVDAGVASVVSDSPARLGSARLQIGETSYSASTRPAFGTIADQSLTTGIALTGPLMFEVPRALLGSEAAHRASIQLALDEDRRVDSQIEVPVDLGALPVEASVETSDPVWGVR
ncbi:hypothetical protein [Herbiconiux sp.]|uniref:hypothetical protein n=1 Tax=Herbiconiux sp. TaxID=1871186 RepID=UPI0025C4025D|nr:hypothetical protein [Herbiconiux sp.]